jgi:hypothetical protein
MGLLGYIFSKSTISLVLGVAPGFATLLLGTLSLKFWRSGRSSVLFILAQAGEKNIVMLSSGVLVLQFIWVTVESLSSLEYMLLMDLIYPCFCSNFCFPGMEVFSCVPPGNYCNSHSYVICMDQFYCFNVALTFYFLMMQTNRLLPWGFYALLR